MIAVGGEFGTLSEIALALKMGKPVIGLGTWELGRDDLASDPIVRAETADAAVTELRQAPPPDTVGPGEGRSGLDPRDGAGGPSSLMVLPVILLLLATGWTVVAIDVVIESARVGARELWAFGHLVATPGLPEGIWIVCAVSATAALAMVTAAAYVRGRRLERRMAAELDESRAEMARRGAGDAARMRLLSWRVAELQTLADRLLDEREASGRQPLVVPDAADALPAID